ncbi:retrovirus-related pol polyprotein from transposon TNT 1-94 [Tanacetum coccineum]|uniref:Retrovirus-related pol polyprotein from transposon TNT 1-94 n=1 Tax=Tanacetum coccineum TaxID=301880 RepID=A0ABQ5H4N4_9ASTR
MAQENYVEGLEDEETKLIKETSYELLKDNEKKQLSKNNEAKMTLYNALPRKEYERIDLPLKNTRSSQLHEKFSISNEETINSGFIQFNAIMISLKYLDPDYSSKNHVGKFLRALPLKWRAKVMTSEEAKDLATLYLDELIGNLKVYEMVLDNDGVASKTTKEKVKSLALKDKVTMEQTSDDSGSQDGSDEDVYEEEGVEAFNLLARNFRKFFHKGNRFGRDNRFGNGANRFGKGRGNSFGNKGGESSKPQGARYNCGIEGHFASECRKLKDNKAFIGGAWSDSEDDDEHQNDATCLMAIDSKINDLQIEVRKLANDKEVVEPCKTCDVYTKEADSLKCNVSKLQDEALNFLKFKESNIALDDMLSRQKLSQDKEGHGFFKNDKTTSVCLKCDLLSNDWIVDSGCTKHIIRNRRLFTSYKAYDGGHVIFGSSLNGKVIGGCNITHDSIIITNVEHVCGLAFNLISVVHLTKFDPESYEGVFLGYSQTSKAYIVLNKETIRIEESLNVTFDESLPEPKSSFSLEDDRIDEPIVHDLNRWSSLQVNVLDEGEARGHPIEQVIGELNERTLRSKTKQA